MSVGARRMPLALYGVTYVFTCLIGAICLLVSPSIVALQHLLAGGRAYWLSPEQIFTNLLLLVVSPLLVAAGYEVALRSLRETPRLPSDASADATPNSALVVAAWALSCAGGFVSLARAGAFGRIDAWTNYRAWVFARWHLFDALSMWEFVNIYILVPVATSLLVMRCSRTGARTLRRAALLLAVVAPMILIDVLVFQKKTLIVSTVIVGLAMAIRFGILDRSTSRRLWLSLAGVALLGWVLYVFTILRPTVGKRAQAMTEPVAQAPPLRAPVPEAERRRLVPKEGAAAASKPPAETPARAEGPPGSTSEESRAAGVGATGKPITEPRRTRALRSVVRRLVPGRWIGLPPEASASAGTLARGPFLTFYVLLGPMLRTPLPALMYPAIYPDRSPFFGTDMGLDVFGIGRMPFDNIQIHRLLWPAIDGGTVMVPFQFASYSQAGLGGALAASFAVGFGLAWIWVRVRAMAFRDEAAVGAALVLILAVYLAGDSIRNSLIASYGVFWGLAFLLAWAQWARREAPPEGAHTAPISKTGATS